MPASKTRPSKSIPVCQNHGFCTSECAYRPTCKKPRTPLLIPALVINYRTGKIYKDEYINDLAISRQNLIDKFVHDREPQLKGKYRPNMKITTV